MRTREDKLYLGVDALTHVNAAMTDVDTAIPVIDVQRGGVELPAPAHGVFVGHHVKPTLLPPVILQTDKYMFVVIISLFNKNFTKCQ